MDALSKTISTDAGKPEAAAVPVKSECVSPGAFIQGEPDPAPLFNPGIFPEPWAARHNRELWLTGPDGTEGWKNGPDGWSFD
jgi:hypothetical protein